MRYLSTFINRNKLNEVECMNVLQDAGLISDNCVKADDVAWVDVEWAEDFLESLVRCRLCGKPRKDCYC